MPKHWDVGVLGACPAVCQPVRLKNVLSSLQNDEGVHIFTPQSLKVLLLRSGGVNVGPRHYSAQ